MILDPRCKLDRLVNRGWKSSYQRQAFTHFERIYQPFYAQNTPPDTVPLPDTSESSNPLPKRFGLDSTILSQREKTEIQCWLDEPRENWQTDALAWWRLYGH